MSTANALASAGAFLLVADDPHSFGLKDSKDTLKLVAAPKNAAVHRPNAVSTILSRFFGALFDLEEGRLACPSVDTEEGAIRQSIKRIVTPFAGRYHAPIEAQQAIEFWTLEKHRASVHA
nr:hypothetical protein [Candidatus Viadribacter manganicus]